MEGLRKAIEAQGVKQTGAGMGMGDADTTIIEQRIKDLDERIYALECSDDSLFTNANGNLPRWQEMQNELRYLRSFIDRNASS